MESPWYYPHYSHSGLRRLGKYTSGDLWNRIDDAVSAEHAGEDGLTTPHPRTVRRGLRFVDLLARNATRISESSREAKTQRTAEFRKIAKREVPKLKAVKLARLGCACESCGTAMPVPSLLHLHHVLPVSRGGKTTDENCALLCPNCHTKAHWLDRELTLEKRPNDVAALVELLRAG